MKESTYYDILQVARDASPEVIASAYRTIMTKLKKHPDLGGRTDEAAVINEAYETLSDPSRRARYDEGLGGAGRDSGSENSSEVERRRVPRHGADATVSYCIGDSSEWGKARVKDVSTLGMRLQSRSPIDVGRHLIIAPANLAAPAIHGTVRWSRKFHPSMFERIYEAGIEFSDQITDIDERIS